MAFSDIYGTFKGGSDEADATEEWGNNGETISKNEPSSGGWKPNQVQFIYLQYYYKSKSNEKMVTKIMLKNISFNSDW